MSARPQSESVAPTLNDLAHGEKQADDEDSRAKNNASYRGYPSPALRTQLDIAERRKNVGQRTRTRCAYQLKHRPQITGNQAK